MGTEGEPGDGAARNNARVIAGRYRLAERLGRGGMSVVWRATDQLLGRDVAVKELPLDETLSAAEARRQRDRTLREARALAQLSHPHIIIVHDVVEDDERPYIVLELIDGGSLADRIATRGPVDAAEAARIGIDLLGALRGAHAAGVLHRDLKPANVLLERGTDRVVLTDFGIAQVAGATTLTESGSFVGSPEYTAPERMSGARTGPESDLWSLGALLCTVLSGESPFRRDSIGGVVHAVVTDEIRPPAQAGPILPVVRGLLERDPDRRLDVDRAERMLRAFRETGRTPEYPPLGYAVATETEGRAAGRAGTAGGSGAGRGAVGGGVGRWRPADGLAGEHPARQPTRSVLVAALAVAAMAGAGVSAAALLLDHDGDGGGSGGGGTPSSTGPRTPASQSPEPRPSDTPRPSRTGRPSATPSPTAVPPTTAPTAPGASVTSGTPSDIPPDTPSGVTSGATSPAA
ncbi:serine/threonine-protein kinase [Streptomyces cathayae]|uniref:non-specific serine/threonine protein kinase n=1 Tax=Streptomyces cathayae TaxID=3031124 RepID=A0ABY8K169_9ACTN|nr:serine/threonine-protein kinase [Streptomyces sp. HUAS 5]WGD41264.1 protein kinase [Streptomyces sp. HUAS 5]